MSKPDSSRPDRSPEPAREPEPESGNRRISPVAATVMVVAIGIVVVYFGLGMVNMGLYAFTQDEYLLGALALAFGAGLVFGPVAVLVSQLRATRRR